MTLVTLPDLSKIASLMSPIFSFASLYTSMPASLDPRQPRCSCVVTLVVASAWFVAWFVAVSANAALVVIAAASIAIARHFEIMMSLHRWRNNNAVGPLF